jgi:hypothetical protein
MTLQPLGDPSAAVCEGDSCLLPGADLLAAEWELQDGEAAEVEPGPVRGLDDAQ